MTSKLNNQTTAINPQSTNPLLAVLNSDTRVKAFAFTPLNNRQQANVEFKKGVNFKNGPKLTDRQLTNDGFIYQGDDGNRYNMAVKPITINTTWKMYDVPRNRYSLYNKTAYEVKEVTSNLTNSFAEAMAFGLRQDTDLFHPNNSNMMRSLRRHGLPMIHIIYDQLSSRLLWQIMVLATNDSHLTEELIDNEPILTVDNNITLTDFQLDITKMMYQLEKLLANNDLSFETKTVISDLRWLTINLMGLAMLQHANPSMANMLLWQRLTMLKVVQHTLDDVTNLTNNLTADQLNVRIMSLNNPLKMLNDTFYDFWENN